ncbi:MAG: hypothetical protein H7836_05325 [Magnetococcus sp. YQC-3]
MKKTVALALLLVLPVGSAAWAADAAKGKQLHDPACMTQCHAGKAGGNANGIYTRKEHLASLEKLKAQVAFCNQQVLNTKWWPEDEADVVEYLNQEFYKFK